MSQTELVSIADEAAGPARALTAAEFQNLADVPPELEWVTNLPNARTRKPKRQR